MQIEKRKIHYLAKKLIIILIGTFIYSAGISLFLDPNELAPGGVVGIAVIASHVLGGSTGSWYFFINIPIILLGWWKFGKNFIIYSFYAIALNSIFTNLFGTFPAVTDNLLLAAVAGSIMIGVGIGLVLRIGATTGGMDIVIKLLRRKYRFIKTSSFFLGIDMLIVAISGFAFKDFDTAMYAFITVIMNGRVLDYVLYGNDEAKLIYIVSNKPDTMLKRILEELDIGATVLKGRGAYSENEKEIIMCVLKKQIAPRLEEIIKQEDEKAFMIVSSANEIYGEGYKDILLDKI